MSSDLVQILHLAILSFKNYSAWPPTKTPNALHQNQSVNHCYNLADAQIILPLIGKENLEKLLTLSLIQLLHL